MPNPQQLKERIYALNPELKALTMGCCIVVKDYAGFGLLGKDAENREILEGFNGEALIINHRIDYSPRDQDGAPDGEDIVIFDLNVYGAILHLENNITEDEIEVLGHAIQPHHILIALNKNNDYHYAISSIGYFVRCSTNEYGWEVDPSMHTYNLKKTFDQNIAENEELVTFLLNIIK